MPCRRKEPHRPGHYKCFRIMRALLCIQGACAQAVGRNRICFDPFILFLRSIAKAISCVCPANSAVFGWCPRALSVMLVLVAGFTLAEQRALPQAFT